MFSKIGQSLTAREILDLVRSDLEKVEREINLESIASVEAVTSIGQYLQAGGGKRLRPILLLLSGKLFAPTTESAIRLAAVVEMIHTATLVHDDVLDGASVRRHAATVNAAWGNQASILLGDYLFTHAFHLTSTLGEADACRLIGEATNRLCAGELHQICERGNLALSEDAYFDIIDGKTAELTSCCCRLGALYGGMDTDSVEQLATYGRSLGMAFQIADDLLDLIGEERSAGKSLGTDLEQQKLTLPVIYHLQQAPKQNTQRLCELLSSPTNHKRDALARELAASGAIDYARGRAEAYAAHAAKHLAVLPASECKDILEYLTDKVVHRDR